MEDPNTPFHPIGGLPVAAMAFAAPELLDSLRNNGSAPLTKATDMYSMGCFAYEVRSSSNRRAGQDSPIVLLVVHREGPVRPE